MKTINHECYVSPEVAKLLKETGFDWQDYFVAHYINEQFHWEIPLHIAQKWLREVKGYYVAWEFNMDISSWGQEFYDFTNISVYIFVDSEQGNICKCKLKENYKTVEEAQEAGIKKALEIILDKED